jgi:hypothetical protein
MNEILKNTLQHFFGSYFHQDCFLDDPNWQAIIRRFLAENSGPELGTISEGIRELLLANLTEVELEKVLDEFGNYYFPPGDGMTYREWLSQVLDKLAN